MDTEKPGDLRRRAVAEIALERRRNPRTKVPPPVSVRARSRSQAHHKGLYLSIRPFPRLYDEERDSWPDKRIALSHGDVGVALQQASDARAILLRSDLSDVEKVLGVYRVALRMVPHYICAACGWPVRLNPRGRRMRPPSWMKKQLRCNHRKGDVDDISSAQEFRTEEEAAADPFFEGKVV